MLLWNFFAIFPAAPDIPIPIAVSFTAFFKLTFPVVIFCSTKFDPNDTAASIATFAAILPIPNVAAPTAPSTNPDAKAPTYCFALPSFPVVTKFVIPVAATLNTPPTNPPNKICAKCPVGSSYINGLL